MRFIFTEKKVQVSDDVRAYAEKKIGKLDRFFRTESDAYVTFSKERAKYIAEVTIKNNGMFYRISEATGDMFASIDSAVASIERQIRKNKTRLEKRLREGNLDWDYRAEVAPTPDEEEPEYEIVRTKRFAMKPMSPEDAILQMNLLDHEFYAFKDYTNNEAFAIVYRRKNGGYGLIESE